MSGIKDRAAVVGVGCSKFGEHYDRSAEDLVCEAAFEAYADARIEPRRIQAAWVGTLSSGFSGTTLADFLKLYDIPVTRVENYCASGMDAFRNACLAVAAGMYDCVLALGFEKLRDSGQRGLGTFETHPVVGHGTTAPSLFAMAANRYFKTYGIGKEALAKVAVKNHHNGTMSPKAHFQMEVTEAQVLAAPLICSPLGLFDCCPTTDGAAAAIVCSPDVARTMRPDPIWVKGIGLAVTSGEPYLKPGFAYTGFPATRAAARSAYAQAGIEARDLDLCEVHDCFTITEILNYEDLGLCGPGEGARYVAEGRADIDGGAVAVNPSGGLKSFGHPIGATGVRMIYEVCQQLWHKAGRRQVKDAQLGLAHNLGGPGAVGCVTVLGNG
ncbi:MAG TPA: acetyl-CoA acetyltransferase [Candidatus Binatia bacterium]|nr:acetyl-CoA acetyltransferase [Candidatus Binatia bacterium]